MFISTNGLPSIVSVVGISLILFDPAIPASSLIIRMYPSFDVVDGNVKSTSVVPLIPQYCLSQVIDWVLVIAVVEYCCKDVADCQVALPLLSDVKTYPFDWLPSTYLNEAVVPVPPTCNVAVGSSVPSKFRPKPNWLVVFAFPSPYNFVVAEPLKTNHNVPDGLPLLGFITIPSVPFEARNAILFW